MDRFIVRLVKEGKLGTLREFTAFNGQLQGDPAQWRLKRAMAGGGSLPDVGIYCLNAARFLSGEEPVEVHGTTFSTPNDPRFREVDETAHFSLRFPSGLVAQCGSSYGTHESKFLRLSGSLGWAEMDPAFSYSGLRLRVGSVVDGKNVVAEPAIESGDQFAHEIDHMSRCVLDDLVPHTPGEEGLQDMRIVEAIYASAQSGRRIALDAPAQATRGPEPAPVDAP
jgi:predicted dehydrogenase